MYIIKLYIKVVEMDKMYNGSSVIYGKKNPLIL